MGTLTLCLPLLTESHALPFIISLLFDRDMKYISNLESEQVRPLATVTMPEVTWIFHWPLAHPWNGAALKKLISVLGGFSVASLLILPPQKYCSYSALRNSVCNSQK